MVSSGNRYSRLLVVLLFMVLFLVPLSSCEGNYDNAGYRLPAVSLTGVKAVVTIVEQDELTLLALSHGISIRQGAVVNGLTIKIKDTCIIYLANTRNGFLALEHELHHCKGWIHAP